jgi:hypothetical protein
MFQFTSQHLDAVNVQRFQQQQLNLGAFISLDIRQESMLGELRYDGTGRKRIKEREKEGKKQNKREQEITKDERKAEED